MSEYEVTATIALNEEQRRIATKIAEEMELSLDGLFRSILLASVMMMSDQRPGGTPQLTPDLRKPAPPPSGDPDTSIDTWYETWYSDVA